MKATLLNIASARGDDHYRAIAERARVSRDSVGDAAKDARMVASLMRRGHLKPFCAVRLYWRVELPLMALWQMRTHEALGNADYDEFNRQQRQGIELSRRYKSSGFEFAPVRPGMPVEFADLLRKQQALGLLRYRVARGRDVPPEVARRLLGDVYGLMTTIAFDCDLKVFLWGLCTERLAAAAQFETRQVVRAMFTRAHERMPVVTRAFMARYPELFRR